MNKEDLLEFIRWIARRKLFLYKEKENDHYNLELVKDFLQEKENREYRNELLKKYNLD